MNRNKTFVNQASLITAGIENIILDSFIEAVNAGNKKIYTDLMSFAMEQQARAFSERVESAIMQWNFFPARIYFQSTTKKDANEEVLRIMPVNYKTISYFFKPVKDTDCPLSERVALLPYFYDGILAFFRLALKNGEEALLIHAINEFNQISGRRIDYDTRIKMQKLSLYDSLDEKKRLRIDSNKFLALEIAHRRAALILLSWNMLLYAEGQQDAKRLDFIINNLKVDYQFFEDLLEDVVYISDFQTKDYYHIRFWDHEERKSGEAYTPPTLSDWIMFGVVYVLLKERMPHFMLGAVVDCYELSFLPGKVNDQLIYYKKNLAMWKPILRFGNWEDAETMVVEDVQSTFEERAEKINNIFSELKKFHERLDIRNIVNSEIDQEKVVEFKRRLYDAWEKNTVAFSVFDFFDNKTTVESDNGLKKMGRRYYLKGFKKMFLKEGGQHIFNSEMYGAEIGRYIDDIFVNTILNSELEIEPLSREDLVSALDAGMEELKGREIVPDVVIVPAGLLSSERLYASEDFSYNQVESPFIGKYKDLNVVTLNSDVWKDQIIVTSFSNAFNLKLLEDPLLYESILHLDIRTLSEEEISTVIQRHMPMFENQNGDDENQAAENRLIAAEGMYLEMWAIGLFEISNTSAISVVSVETPL